MPAILSDVGGIPEMCRDLDMDLLRPGDVDGLAKAMNRFLDQPSVFLERAEMFRDVVAKRYTVEIMARDLTQFYRELVTV